MWISMNCHAGDNVLIISSKSLCAQFFFLVIFSSPIFTVKWHTERGIIEYFQSEYVISKNGNSWKKKPEKWKKYIFSAECVVVWWWVGVKPHRKMFTIALSACFIHIVLNWCTSMAITSGRLHFSCLLFLYGPFIIRWPVKL